MLSPLNLEMFHRAWLRVNKPCLHHTSHCTDTRSTNFFYPSVYSMLIRISIWILFDLPICKSSISLYIIDEIRNLGKYFLGLGSCLSKSNLLIKSNRYFILIFWLNSTWNSFFNAFEEVVTWKVKTSI